ncbi:MAG: SUMF1/EgtB/PvdO family nonheme iron enzyme [Candidatus Riflebacteria bacterium]|nr:SUMF1/EgtB/PvdO family nonheme iron enzyme [Candidatus Riflebacteria bacterium]
MADAETCPHCRTPFPAGATAATAIRCRSCGGDVAVTDVTQVTIVARSPGGVHRACGQIQFSKGFLGLYRIVSVLGSGAMGTVFSAEQLSIRRPVAMKFLTAPFDPDLMARFIREGKVMARVRHPHVMSVYESGTEGGHPYLVMELMDGGSLGDHLRAKGTLPWKEAVAVAAKCLEGLGACHEQGIIHRDLKPENILFTGSGEPKIGDFGIARLFEGDQRLTQTGELIGTPRYMPPEVFRGEVATASTDLYSMGIVLYAMISGQPPFSGPSFVELANAHLSQTPPPLPAQAGVPRSVANVLMAALSKTPGGRPTSAADFAQALQVAAFRRATGPKSPHAPKMASATTQGHSLKSASNVGLGIACLLVLAVLVWMGRTGARSPTRQTASASPGSIVPRPVEPQSPTGSALPRVSRTAFRESPSAFSPSRTPNIGPPLPPAGLKLRGKNARGYWEATCDADGAVMVLVPAGEFFMGSEKVGESDEHPKHRVYLDAFYMDKTEVTNRRYQEFVQATGHQQPGLKGEARFNEPDQPVVGVSWDDAVAYCRWAGKELPTEAQWERAARGGLEGKRYPWGNEDPKGRACFGLDGLTGRPGPVATLSANGFGLHDMAGNAWEWCADWYAGGYYGTSPRQNPTGPPQGTERVVRGGAFHGPDNGLLCAARHRADPAGRYLNYGFRCLRSVGSPQAVPSAGPEIQSSPPSSPDASSVLATPSSSPVASPLGGPGHSLIPLGRNPQGLEEYRSEPDEAVMVMIPAGEFLMGSANGTSDEKPVHRVYLDAFLIDKHEVTNSMYRKFTGATGHPEPSYSDDPGRSQPEQPVVGVSWDDAVAFCKWAGKRLPTEAEWEKAARGGLVGAFYPWGDERPEGKACCNDGKTERAAKVGSYRPNGYGLHDMAGNASEWCSDWYDAGWYVNSPLNNPTGPKQGDFHVRRGGSRSSYVFGLRCSTREGDDPTGRSRGIVLSRWGADLGFRCARSLLR